MDQRSDDIRQDIESTRAALDEKLDTLETKARQTFDLKYQVAERPWIALGAAVAAGFVVGNMGGDEEQRWHGQPATTTDYNQHATYTAPARQEKSSVDSLYSQFDDEIEMIKGAALSALTNFLHDSIRAYLPAMGNYLNAPNRPSDRTPSTATNASYRAGAGKTGFDSPPVTSSQLSNPEAGGSASYYPPGSTGADARDYVKTYHPPDATERERAVGDETRY